MGLMTTLIQILRSNVCLPPMKPPGSIPRRSQCHLSPPLGVGPHSVGFAAFTSMSLRGFKSNFTKLPLWGKERADNS